MSKAETPENLATDVETVKSEKSKFVVASQVRSLIRDKEFCVSNELIDALSHKVEQILGTAILRAEANGRKTVRPCDL